jgi:hypothetical protein
VTPSMMENAIVWVKSKDDSSDDECTHMKKVSLYICYASRQCSDDGHSFCFMFKRMTKVEA